VDIHLRQEHGWFYRNSANLITIFGIVLCFPLLYFVLWHGECIWTILGLVVFICLTDLADGKVARRLNITSPFGVAADRYRDKGIMFIMFYFLLLDPKTDMIIKILMALLAVMEFVLLVQCCVGIIFHKSEVSANDWGKRKMFLMSAGMIMCVALIAMRNELGLVSYGLALISLWLIFLTSLGFSFLSLYGHIFGFKKQSCANGQYLIDRSASLPLCERAKGVGHAQ
jgi:CDP-diacylglycerol--glycerol-3-phosphate 3-phosphatidyltransferase